MSVAETIRANGGARFRQYSSSGLGGSTERVLQLRPDGRFDYVETEQYDGGASRHPRTGRWVAEGDLPVGRLILTFDDGETLSLALEYHGGDTCRIDGVPTYVS
jgi:hypothetical protein